MKNRLAKFGYFLTTFIIPKRMKQYRKMSLLFSVLIFFALSYLVIAPDIIKLSAEQKKQPHEVSAEIVTGLEPLIDNQSNELLEDLLPTKVNIEKGTFSATFDYTYSKFTIFYQTGPEENKVNNSVTFVFDMTSNLKNRTYDINSYKNDFKTGDNENDMLLVFTNSEVTYFPKRDADGVTVTYEQGGTGITEITKKTTSKDLTAFIAGYLEGFVDEDALTPLKNNTSEDSIDSVPIEATLTSNILSVTFDYIYREIPFTITTEDDTVNMLLVFDLFDTSKRSTGRFDYITYHQKAIHDVDEQDLLFVFETKQARYYETHDTNYGTDKAQSRIDHYLNFAVVEIDTENFPLNSKDLTVYLAQYLIINRILYAKQSFTLSSFIMNVIIPLIMIFFFFLIFKRSGVLKKFKEYYNIGAIAFIPTSIIIFILGFFVSYTEVFIIYFPIQSLFFIFCLFMINVDASSEDDMKPQGPNLLRKDIIDTTYEPLVKDNTRGQDMVSSDYIKNKKRK